MNVQDNRIEKQILPKDQFKEIEDGLMAMFRTCVDRHENAVSTRKAGIRAARALMELHRDFKPGN